MNSLRRALVVVGYRVESHDCAVTELDATSGVDIFHPHAKSVDLSCGRDFIFACDGRGKSDCQGYRFWRRGFLNFRFFGGGFLNLDRFFDFNFRGIRKSDGYIISPQSGSATYIFVREGGTYKLLSMSDPIIFGFSRWISSLMQRTYKACLSLLISLFLHTAGMRPLSFSRLLS